MKTSTLLIMVTLSASCFAAPDVAAQTDIRPERWEHIALPKSRHLDRGFVAEDEHPQT